MRRSTRRFAGKRGGRRFFWYRVSPTAMTLREAATATHSDIFVDEGFWQFQSSLLNDTQRGGPMLHRLIVDFGLSVEAQESWFLTSGAANIALIPEFMIWKQSDQFATIVTSSASFDSTREDQRILMDEVPRETTFCKFTVNDRGIRSTQGRYETKVKCRLADSALGIAWRGFFNTGSGALAGYTDWARVTFLISTP